jgi:hypothetical protein
MADRRISIPRVLRRRRGSSNRGWRCRLDLEVRCRRVGRCHLLALGGWDHLVFRRSSRHRRDMVGGEAVEEERRFKLVQGRNEVKLGLDMSRGAARKKGNVWRTGIHGVEGL